MPSSPALGRRRCLVELLDVRRLLSAATFDFDTGTPTVVATMGMPASQTKDGVTAYFSAGGGSGWSVQSDATTQWRLSQFSGNYLDPTSLTPGYMVIGFSQSISTVTFSFCTADFQQVEIPTTVRTDAYQDAISNPIIATATAHGTYGGDTMPMGTMQLSSATAFNTIKVWIPWQANGASDFLVDNITVTTASAVGQPPVAANDVVQAKEDEPVTVNVLANDTDPNAGAALDPTTVVIDTAPTKGSVSIDPVSGAITYMPYSGVYGTDTFTYTVNDSLGLTSSPGLVTVNVLPFAAQADNGFGALTVEGTPGNDTITLDHLSDSLLVTRNGIQMWFVYNTITGITVSAEAGADTITVGPGIMGCALHGGKNGDTMTGGDGNDTITGDRANDVVYGGLGDDYIRGGNGYDTLYGQDGNDIIWGDAQANTLNGGNGNDTMHGGDGPDLLMGAAGDDVMYAAIGGSSIRAGLGNDTIYARNGAGDNIDGMGGINSAQVDAGLDVVANVQTLLA